MPDITASPGLSDSSKVSTAPYLAPVSRRAPAATSRSTAFRSKLSLMRRLAVLKPARRSRSASFSRLSWSDPLNVVPGMQALRRPLTACVGHERP